MREYGPKVVILLTFGRFAIAARHLAETLQMRRCSQHNKRNKKRLHRTPGGPSIRLDPSIHPRKHHNPITLPQGEFQTPYRQGSWGRGVDLRLAKRPNRRAGVGVWTPRRPKVGARGELWTPRRDTPYRVSMGQYGVSRGSIGGQYGVSMGRWVRVTKRNHEFHFPGGSSEGIEGRPGGGPGRYLDGS
eukprot:1176497-Prorocentrum_minimum.AAC.2